jgi:hypothetical protein
MATWRRRAIELFPDLQPELNSPEYTIYSLFVDLSSAMREAHRADDDERLANIYGFAEWCARQRSQPLWNSAGVVFYEHVFDEPRLSEAVAAWLPADIRAQHVGPVGGQAGAKGIRGGHEGPHAIPLASSLGGAAPTGPDRCATFGGAYLLRSSYQPHLPHVGGTGLQPRDVRYGPLRTPA